MNSYSIIFYALAVVLVVSTFLAVSRRNAMHAVVYLIISFIATGLTFYVLGAPFLALLEIIIYAGAIMVLFLFIVMMLRMKPSGRGRGAALIQWSPAIILGIITLGIIALMVFTAPESLSPLKAYSAGPEAVGRYLFQRYWFPVEIASFLLLIALVGALYLGRFEVRGKDQPHRRNP